MLNAFEIRNSLQVPIIILMLTLSKGPIICRETCLICMLIKKYLWRLGQELNKQALCMDCIYFSWLELKNILCLGRICSGWRAQLIIYKDLLSEFQIAFLAVFLYVLVYTQVCIKWVGSWTCFSLQCCKNKTKQSKTFHQTCLLMLHAVHFS